MFLNKVSALKMLVTKNCLSTEAENRHKQLEPTDDLLFIVESAFKDDLPLTYHGQFLSLDSIPTCDSRITHSSLTQFLLVTRLL